MSKPKIDGLGLGNATGIKISSQPDTERKVERPPSRQGKSTLVSHHDPAVTHQLKLLAVELNTTQQDLMAEALNLLFLKYNRPTLALVKRRY